MELLVNEIFHSIQGEGSRAGLPCIFIRLHGCKLRCVWCDTPYALDKRQGGVPMDFDMICEQIYRYGTRFVEFTGGEPLEQPDVAHLMKRLLDEGFTVAVETGGHIDVSFIDPRVIRIMDLKCPDSRMESLNKYENIAALQPHDEVKFVIGSRRDYEWARQKTLEYNLPSKVHSVLYSPVFEKINYRELVEWILADKLPVRMQLQLHKYIWDPQTRGV